MGNNPNLDLVNMNAYMKFGEILLVKFCQFVLKILSGNEILNKIMTSVKGHNSITNAWNMMCNNPNLDLVNINAHTKFGEILSIWSEDNERKRKPDGQTYGMRVNPNPV